MKRSVIEQAMVDDFGLIIAHSPLLDEAYKALPSGQRETVDNRFLELMWQMVLARADELRQMTSRMAGRTLQQFGGFMVAAKAGKSIIYQHPDWVAIDRKSYDRMVARAEKNDIKIFYDEYKDIDDERE